jgi:hypothetical protein
MLVACGAHPPHCLLWSTDESILSQISWPRFRTLILPIKHAHDTAWSRGASSWLQHTSDYCRRFEIVYLYEGSYTLVCWGNDLAELAHIARGKCHWPWPVFGIVARHRAGRSCVRTAAATAVFFSLLQNVKTRSGAHPASFSRNTGVIFRC